MPVGAGSIKRAAKAAKTDVIANPAEEVKNAVKAETEAKAEKPVAEKKTTEKQSAAKKTATKKTVTKKQTAKNAETKQTETKKPAAQKSTYEAYGVGQKLPIHLM